VDRSIGLIGVPTSAGAFAPGQELAPAALREAGLVDALRESGVEMRDHGDREPWRWRPDRDDRRAQNLAKVVEVVRDTAARVSEAAGSGEIPLVLGGDCTVGVGTVAGLVEGAEPLGVVYFDLHADLNVPERVQPGTLDWMGMAHMLAEDGARRELVEAGPRVPLLDDEQVVFLGWGREQAQPGEREAIERRALATVPVDEVAAGPAAAAAGALDLLGAWTERVLVHFDVDVIDFTDTPLSEEVGRNQGLAYGDAITALEVLLASPQLAGLTVTELNPAHVEEGAGSVERLARDLARGLGGAG
jgi:arginase